MAVSKMKLKKQAGSFELLRVLKYCSADLAASNPLNETRGTVTRVVLSWPEATRTMACPLPLVIEAVETAQRNYLHYGQGVVSF